MMFFTLIDPFTDIHGSWRIFYTFTANAEKGARGVDHNRDSVPARPRFVNPAGVDHPRVLAFLVVGLPKGYLKMRCATDGSRPR